MAWPGLVTVLGVALAIATACPVIARAGSQGTLVGERAMATPDIEDRDPELVKLELAADRGDPAARAWLTGAGRRLECGAN